MAHEYNNQIAKHYAAFRPDLHTIILNRLIMPDEHFKVGIDVGCGTGYSSIALVEYCDKVFGLDPNQSMLDQTIIHPRIFYVNGSGNDFSIINEERFDIISFAGSLSYTKTNKLKSELLRTLSPDGIVIVYDFQISFEDLIANIGLEGSNGASGYNFTENLKDWPEFISKIINTEKINLYLSAQETAHVLLANSYRYLAFRKRFNKNDPFESLTNYIAQQNDKTLLKAEIYYARYCVA